MTTMACPFLRGVELSNWQKQNRTRKPFFRSNDLSGHATRSTATVRAVSSVFIWLTPCRGRCWVSGRQGVHHWNNQQTRLLATEWDASGATLVLFGCCLLFLSHDFCFTRFVEWAVAARFYHFSFNSVFGGSAREFGEDWVFLSNGHPRWPGFASSSECTSKRRMRTRADAIHSHSPFWATPSSSWRSWSTWRRSVGCCRTS